MLEALNLSVELIDVGNVASTQYTGFGNNPLLKVPVLQDGAYTIFDSDQICRYLVDTYDPADQFAVLDKNIERLNARTIMNGVMSAEVELILAKRIGLDIRQKPFFDKKFQVIENSLHWLDIHHELFVCKPDYLGFHLVCMWEHLHWFGHVLAQRFVQLERLITYFQNLPMVLISKPT